MARLISKYDLLALPVVDQARRILGIVTVDDVIDVMVSEQTEDAQKFGGLQALDEPYPEVGFGAMIRKRAGWLTALFIGEMFTTTAMGRFEHECGPRAHRRGNLRLSHRLDASVRAQAPRVRPPPSASAPFVATLVDVTGILIYFTVAALVLRGTVL